MCRLKHFSLFEHVIIYLWSNGVKAVTISQEIWCVLIATRAITHHLLHIQVLLSCEWLDYDGKRRLRLSLSRSEADRGWVLTVSLSETSIKWRGRSVPHNRAESAMLGADDAGYRVAKHPKTRTSLCHGYWCPPLPPPPVLSTATLSLSSQLQQNNLQILKLWTKGKRNQAPLIQGNVKCKKPHLDSLIFFVMKHDWCVCVARGSYR